jgi:hypothetical protein
MHRGLPRINMILGTPVMLFSRNLPPSDQLPRHRAIPLPAARVKPARLPGLIPGAFGERVRLEKPCEKEATWQSRLTNVIRPAPIWHGR